MGQYDIEDDDDFDSDDDGGSQTLRQLRQANRKQAKQLKELTDQLAKFQQQERAKTIGDVLASKGLNTKISAFYPADAEADEASVSKWLDEYGDVFGAKKDDSPAIPPDEIAARRQMDAVGQAAGTQPGAGTLEAQIKAATSADELLKLIAGSG